jgi:Lrp/AsnC family leucine-responsive transcriptional regulator
MTSISEMEGLVREIDDLDRKILSLLSENPQISQAALSESLEISQPAVSARIHKLEEKGALAYLVGTDVKKAQLFLAKVEVSTDHVEQVLNFLDTCPLYLNSFLTSGKNNMTILLVGENIRSIMSCVDSHLRQGLQVRNMEFDLIVTPIRPLIVPIKPSIEKRKITPCNADCSTCTLYAGDRCLGCPASIDYRGNLL